MNDARTKKNLEVFGSAMEAEICRRIMGARAHGMDAMMNR